MFYSPLQGPAATQLFTECHTDQTKNICLGVVLLRPEAQDPCLLAHLYPRSCSSDPLHLVFASQFSLCFSAQQACLCWYFTFQQSHCSAVISKTSSAVIIFSKSSTIIISGFGIDRTHLISWSGQQLDKVTWWQLLLSRLWQSFKPC